MATRAGGSGAAKQSPERSDAPGDASALSWTGGSAASLAAWLRAHGVDPTFASAANDAKSLSELATEVARGETTLVSAGDDEASGESRAVRRVRVLRLLIRDARGRVLIEARQAWSDGRVRERGTPLSEKMLRGEDWRDAARRAVVEELGSCLTSDGAGGDVRDAKTDARLDERLVTLDESSVVFSSAEKTSVSYPGLRSAYDFVTVDARVRGLPECDGTFVSTRDGDGDGDGDGEPSFTSTERGADGTTLVATWVWREGHFVDDGT